MPRPKFNGVKNDTAPCSFEPKCQNTRMYSKEKCSCIYCKVFDNTSTETSIFVYRLYTPCCLVEVK